MVHSLGDIIDRHQLYDVRQVYARSSCSIPVVFLLPAASEPEELTSTAGSHSYMDVIVLHMSDVVFIVRDTESADLDQY